MQEKQTLQVENTRVHVLILLYFLNTPPPPQKKNGSP